MDVVVTVPQRLWAEWLDEGCLPDDERSELMAEFMVFHFWLQHPLPDMRPGDRVYVVAHGRLRGYAPLVGIEQRCRLRPSMGCLVRRGGSVAVTIDRPIRGFRGWRYVDWKRSEEHAFPDYRTAGVPGTGSLPLFEGA